MMHDPVKSESKERIARMVRALRAGASPDVVRAEFSPSRNEMWAAQTRVRRMRRKEPR